MHLMIENCDATELIKEYGSPLYVLSEATIKAKCGEIRNDFLNRYDRVYAAYASKAFLTTGFVKLMARESFHMDVVSGGELYTAINADYDLSKVIFHGNNKSTEEITMAVENKVGRMVVDHVEELYEIEAIAKKYSQKMAVFFRITPGVSATTHAYISTGQKDSKFGLSLDEAVLFPIIEHAIDSAWIDFKGFHFHVGSQLFTNDAHIGATKVALGLIKRVKEVFDYEVSELNVGGGFGIKYTDTCAPQSVAYFTDAIMGEIESYCQAHDLYRPSIYIEPGRFIVGEAGTTLYTVGAKKVIEGIRTYVAVDGGMTDNIRPALYQAKYMATVANKVDAPRDEVVTVCGKCCETGDILIEHIGLQSLVPGDILAVFSTGAYNYSMASHYNKQRIPAVVLVSGDQSYELIKRETYDDLVKNDVIPSFLK